jgi:hypothetical protein
MKKPGGNSKAVVKVLTGFRLDPRVKLLAAQAASEDHRSLSNYIEHLIWCDVEERGLHQSTKPKKKR